MDQHGQYVPVNSPKVMALAGKAHAYGELTPVAPSSDADLDVIGKIRMSDVYLPHCGARIYEGAFDYDAVLANEGSDFIGSCFFLEGNFTTSLKGNTTQKTYMTTGYNNIKYDPNNEYAHYSAAGSPFKIVHFSMTPDYFFSMFHDDDPIVNLLHDHVDKRRRIIGQTPALISAEQHKAIDTVFNCPINGQLGLMMKETSIIQAMLIQLHTLFHIPQETTSSKISTRDADVIHGVREHLNKTFLDEHSMNGLARHFGTNTNKLMTLFRKMFGISIFEYLNELKMAYARNLLEEGLFVAEVARSVGYKNAHHFSTAFKRKYGMTPSHVKR